MLSRQVLIYLLIALLPVGQASVYINQSFIPQTNSIVSTELHDLNNLEGGGQLANKIGHTVLGCATASLQNQDCQSAAVGSVIGEVSAELMRDGILEDESLKGLSGDEYLKRVNELTQEAIDKSRLIGASVAFAAGLDPNTAADAAENAAENNAFCGGACIGFIAVLLAAYTTHSGEGDLHEGLAKIGSGDDPVSQAISAGTSATVKWSATEYPDQTATVLGVLEATGNAIDATVTYVDDATGNKVSKSWNEIPEHTRNQIKGGAKIASILVPAGLIKILKQLKTASKGRKIPKGGVPNGIGKGDNVVTRLTRQGDKAVHITREDGSIIDISPNRVKEFTTNTHPKAPPGKLQKTKFDNALPGSKGIKREPTQQELDLLKDLTK